MIDTTKPRFTFNVFSRITLRGRRWFFNLKAGNGEIIAQSEGYVNKSDAHHAIQRIKTYAPSAVTIVELPK